jgi:hypothetical protein
MVAGEHDIKPTCLSDWEHDSAIQNHVLHYLGCIEIGKRETFYEENSDLWKRELENELGRQKKESKDPQRDGGLETAEAIIKERLQRWQEACGTEVRRIGYLRALLAKDKEVRHLVDYLEKSRDEWEKTPEFKKGLQEVKRWRAKPSIAKSEGETDPSALEDLPETDPRGGRGNQPQQQEVDLRHHTQPSSSGELLITSGSPASLVAENKPKSKEPLPQDPYEPEKDFNIHIIKYESQSVHTKRELPDQKVKVHEILEKTILEKAKETVPDWTKNPLYRGETFEKLSYIHTCK